MKNILICLNLKWVVQATFKWVAQATRLSRPATGRTEWKERLYCNQAPKKAHALFPFRTASRRSGQASGLCYPLFRIAGLIFVTTFIAQAEPVKIQLPPETAVYKSGPGADVANAQCLTCHSADYAAMQPPMPAKFWKGAVDKMIAKYAAPIETNQVDALVEYFAKHYGTDGTNAAASTVAKQIPTDASTDPKQLMQKNGCFNCHTVDKKFIGPAFKDVAGKYNGTSDAFAKVAHQIQNGGSGLWGPIPMPPFKQFSQVEVKILSDWILAQK